MELSKKFNNRSNDHVFYGFNSQSTGIKIKQDFFVGRATALVGVILAFTPDGLSVLITKRSDKMRDEANKVGIPCGYLDWDESRYEGMMREIYEETSLYMPDYEKYVIFNNNKEAFYVKDNPKTDKRQNVSHLFLTVYDFAKSEEAKKAFPIGIEAFTCRETTWVKWMKIVDFYATYMNYEWAFNHDETIKSALKFFNSNFSREEL
jgi:8-oxo-dGTP pyrophosphatase MutT (NUDIX family)